MTETGKISKRNQIEESNRSRKENDGKPKPCPILSFCCLISSYQRDREETLQQFPQQDWPSLNGEEGKGHAAADCKNTNKATRDP